MKESTSHLSVLNFNFHTALHCSRPCRSDCRLWQSDSLKIEHETLASSAYKAISALGDRLSPISFVYRRKRIGPSRKPCRTPDVTGSQTDPSTTTLCVSHADNYETNPVKCQRYQTFAVWETANYVVWCQMPCWNQCKWRRFVWKSPRSYLFDEKRLITG